MLLPRRTKFRKVHRGRRRGNSKGQTTVQFGDFGLKSLEAGWITNRQIEAARIAMTRKIRRGGKVWINVFPDKSYTKTVSYTHLRAHETPEHLVCRLLLAHETPEHLVCRLLLDKKKNKHIVCRLLAKI